jgi:biopolymer transport protein ExbD
MGCLAAACRSHPQAQSGVTPDPSEGQAKPAASAGKLEAYLRCQKALTRTQSDSPQTARSLASACADLYSAPECANAMRNPPADPARFSASIAQACAHAYCARLREPRPELCRMEELPPPSQLGRAYQELNRQILALELGVSADLLDPPGLRPAIAATDFDGHATSIPLPDVVASAQPAAKVADPTVHVSVAPAAPVGVRVALGGAQHVILVASDDSAGALAALARDARLNASPDARVVLSIDRSINYGYVVLVLDSFRQAGFSHIAFAVESKGQR